MRTVIKTLCGLGDPDGNRLSRLSAEIQTGFRRANSPSSSHSKTASSRPSPCPRLRVKARPTPISRQNVSSASGAWRRQQGHSANKAGIERPGQAKPSTPGTASGPFEGNRSPHQLGRRRAGRHPQNRRPPPKNWPTPPGARVFRPTRKRCKRGETKPHQLVAKSNECGTLGRDAAYIVLDRFVRPSPYSEELCAVLKSS
jgi:hypothetical protein